LTVSEHAPEIEDLQISGTVAAKPAADSARPSSPWFARYGYEIIQSLR
jgi:hypothetical protein